MAFKMKKSPVMRKVKAFTSPIDMRSPVKNDEKDRFEKTYENIDFDALRSMEAPTYTDTTTDVRVDPDTSVEVKDPNYYYLADGTKVRKSSGKITLTKGDRMAREMAKKNPVATLFTGRGK